MDENACGSVPQDRNEKLPCDNSSTDLPPLVPEEIIGHSTKTWVRLQSSLAYEASYVAYMETCKVTRVLWQSLSYTKILVLGFSLWKYF